jgi:hypothetical protein
MANWPARPVGIRRYAPAAVATPTDSPARARVIRAALAAIAVIVIAWFAIGARQAHLVDAATKLLDNEAGQHADSTRQTESLLRSAELLNPGVNVTLLRARLAMEQHAWPRATRLVHDATTAEPDNLEAWISALDLAIAHSSSIDLSTVLTHLRTLDPIDARSFKR